MYKFLKVSVINAIILTTTVSVFSQTKLYENPRFDVIAEDHNIIAIMPFKASVVLRPKEMAEMTPEQLLRMEEAEGEGVQLGMYSWFLNREKRGTLTVKVQSPSITNAKLNQEGITYENFEGYTPDQLAKLLEVDAIIMGTFETNKPMSEGATAALGLLIGVWGSTNKAVINLSIFNGVDNELLVNYYKGISGSMGSSTEDLVNILMRKVSRRIAYTKTGS